MQEWTIVASDDGMLDIFWGRYNGQMQHKTERVNLNQSGRDIAAQTMLEFNSRVNTQILKGYRPSVFEAENSASKNALGFPKPMLALVPKSLDKVQLVQSYMQRKYDGNRCLIASTDNGLVAYSRKGKVLDNLEHILDSMELPIGTVIDGEVYCHGESLQTICSWIKRAQPKTSELTYHAYDVISELPFYDRFNRLTGLQLGENAHVAPTVRAHSMSAVIDEFTRYRAQGYEGAILRNGLNGYACDKRSTSLLKLKKWLDDEFPVLDVDTNNDGWGILVLRSKAGVIFKATAPGTVVDKQHVGATPLDYIGKLVQVEYAYVTADGVPFHPVAKGWVR